MSTQQHLDKWAKLSGPIKRAGAKSYAFVAVDEHGEVFYGANFGFQPQSILGKLNEMRHDVKQYIKRQERTPA